MFKALFTIGFFLIFQGCSSKELKHYGGNLALNNSSSPVMVVGGLVIGGSIYGIGSLVEKTENSKKTQKDINE